jgi:hypothetical protein
VSGKGWSAYENTLNRGPTAAGMGNSYAGIMGMLVHVEETVDRNMLGKTTWEEGDQDAGSE